MREPGAGRRGLMPGVPDLLARSPRGRPRAPRLLTGNYEAGARIKLTHFGLWDRFAWGAFGDHHAERDALARTAIAMAPGRGVALDDPSHAMVVGDTPHDVACARAAGARVIAVATGGHSVDDLRACAPDLALEDLRDVDAVLAFIDAIVRSAIADQLEFGGSAWESNPACPQGAQRPVLKTGRATGPRSLPSRILVRVRMGTPLDDARGHTSGVRTSW